MNEAVNNLAAKHQLTSDILCDISYKIDELSLDDIYECFDWVRASLLVLYNEKGELKEK